jgi:hypothetical protein
MSDYFLVLDAALLEEQIRPALAASWRQRSFAPCLDLCRALLPAARDYWERYHVGPDEPLLSRVVAGLEFDRPFWRALVGEVLVFAATEIPELQTCQETLVQLVGPGTDRAQPSPLDQAHRGSRDLTLGAAVYRPDHVGYNNRDDVARLADYLASLRPAEWSPVRLAGLTEEDAVDELEFAREWFPVLVDLFRRANDRGQVLIHERMY